MMSITVPQAYKRLVILLAHMFYSGQCPPTWWIDASEGPKKDTQAEDMLEDKRAAQLAREARRKAQADTTGLGIVVLTALTERQWVEEDEFARSLNLPPKMVRKAMRFLEEEQLVMREHRKETKRARREERNLQAQAGLRDAKGAPAAAAAGPDGQPAAEEEEEEAINVGHVISYCALDYPRIVDSVRWRIDTIRKNLTRECRNKDVEQRYKCPNPACGKEYSSMDVFDLMEAKSTELKCGICGTPIELLLADGKTGSADERKTRLKRAKELLNQYDMILGPLIQQLSSIETITAPDFSTYHTWLANQAAVRSHIAAIEKGTANGSRPNGPAPKPVFTANTQVVLSFDSNKPSEAAGSSAAAAAPANGRAAEQPEAAGPAAAAAAGGARPLPPFLQSAMAGSAKPAQAPARKPLPPWLMSSMVQQQQQSQQQQQQQQQQHPTGSTLQSIGANGLAVKQDEGPWGVKADPEQKLESKPEIKPEAAMKQEPNGGAAMQEDDDDDEWEDASAAAPAGGSTTAVAAVGAPIAEEDDWEDV